MSQSFTTARLEQVFAFPFRDPTWKNKLLTGSAIYFSGMIVPIVPWLVVYGYGLRLARSIIVDRREPYLPEWNNWGEMLLDGLKLAAVYLVYALPALVLMFAGWAVMMAQTLSIEFMEGPYESIASLLGPSLAATFGGMALMGAGMLLSLAVGILTVPAMGHLAATGSVGAALRVRRWWPVFRANLGGFFVAWVIVMGTGVVLSLGMQVLYFTIVLCCLIPFVMAPVSVYVMLIAFSLFAEAYRVGADQRPVQAQEAVV